MSKRKASQALDSRVDLASENPSTIASTLLSWMHDDTTAQHQEAKKLLRAFSLVKTELDRRSRAMALVNEEQGKEEPIVLSFVGENDQVALPREVFGRILGYLSEKDLMSGVSHVSKAWLSVARSPAQWTSLLYGHRGRRSGRVRSWTMTSLVALLSRPQFSRLKSLVVPAVTSLGKEGIKKLAQSCPELEELEFGYYSPPEIKVKDKDLMEACTHVTKLSKIRFSIWLHVTSDGIENFAVTMGDRLQELRIVASAPYSLRHVTDDTLECIALNCPNLERFALGVRIPTDTDISGDGMLALIRGCIKLKTLALFNTLKVSLLPFQLIAEQAPGTCRLERLVVRAVPCLFGSEEAVRVRTMLADRIQDLTIGEGLLRDRYGCDVWVD